MKAMKWIASVTLSVVLLFVMLGCSVYMASHQPSLKDLSVLTPGTSRDRVIAEFGAPVSSEVVEGGKHDVYTFEQGYSKGAKNSRAFFHGAADVLTIGLWEIVGTPVESSFNGKRISVAVTYDKDEKVKESKTLSVSEK